MSEREASVDPRGFWQTPASLVGEQEQGEFFGLYSLSSRVAAIIGPLLWGVIVYLAAAWPVGKYRLAVASLAVLEVAAAFVFASIKNRAKPTPEKGVL